MNRLEVIAVLIVIVGVVCKVLHWPFADEILIISVGTLCIIDLAELRLLAENIGLREWFKTLKYRSRTPTRE